MKKILLIIVSLVALAFIFTPNIAPNNPRIEDILSLAQDKDVIIIFNSGGWGYSPLEKAADFEPIIKGIQDTLKEWGYNSVVIPYKRTENSFFGKISSSSDFLNAFDFSSDNLVSELELISERLPGKKIILAGLSSGGAFVNRTYEKVSNNIKGSVLTIAAGTPFWIKEPDSENVLQLTNSGGDTLSKGDFSELLIAFVKGPFIYLSSKFSGGNLSWGNAFHAQGHDYAWSSPEINSEIVGFLGERLGVRN